jgi:hypothetical protein
MRMLLPAVLLAASALIPGPGHAADGCGPGCHNATYGGCVVDGWTAPRLRNECPAGARPHPPCGRGSVWKYGACFPN